MIAQQLFLDVQEFGRQAKQVRCSAGEGLGVVFGWGTGRSSAACARAVGAMRALSHPRCGLCAPAGRCGRFPAGELPPAVAHGCPRARAGRHHYFLITGVAAQLASVSPAGSFLVPAGAPVDEFERSTCSLQRERLLYNVHYLSTPAHICAVPVRASLENQLKCEICFSSAQHGTGSEAPPPPCCAHCVRCPARICSISSSRLADWPPVGKQ